MLVDNEGPDQPTYLIGFEVKDFQCSLVTAESTSKIW